MKMICPLDVATELMETLPIYGLGVGGLVALTAKAGGENVLMIRHLLM
jgi:hypothetical protein